MTVQHEIDEPLKRQCGFIQINQYVHLVKMHAFTSNANRRPSCIRLPRERRGVMALSWDEDYRSRRPLRRGGRLLVLREPALASGVAALVIMYAMGLIAVLWAVTGFARVEVTAATALALPVGAATAATALAVGTRLRRYEEKTRYGLLLKVAAVWAFFGAAWPTIHLVSDAAVGGMGGDGLAGWAQIFAVQAGAGAVVGMIGGLAGGLAALALCIESRR